MARFSCGSRAGLSTGWGFWAGARSRTMGSMQSTEESRAKVERRRGLKAAVLATVVVTGSLSWMAARKHADAAKLSGELLAKATLPDSTQFRAPDDAEVQVFKLTIHPG